MLLKEHTDSLSPEKRIGILVKSNIWHDGLPLNLCRVSPESLEGMREREQQKIYGVPQFIAIYDNGELHFYPAAAYEFNVDIYFHPPVDMQ